MKPQQGHFHFGIHNFKLKSFFSRCVCVFVLQIYATWNFQLYVNRDKKKSCKLREGEHEDLQLYWKSTHSQTRKFKLNCEDSEWKISLFVLVRRCSFLYERKTSFFFSGMILIAKENNNTDFSFPTHLKTRRLRWCWCFIIVFLLHFSPFYRIKSLKIIFMLMMFRVDPISDLFSLQWRLSDTLFFVNSIFSFSPLAHIQRTIFSCRLLFTFF